MSRNGGSSCPKGSIFSGDSKKERRRRRMGGETTDRGWLEVKKRVGGDEVAEGGKSRVRSSRGRVFFSLPFCFYFYLFLILSFLLSLSRPLCLSPSF